MADGEEGMEFYCFAAKQMRRAERALQRADAPAHRLNRRRVSVMLVGK